METRFATLDDIPEIIELMRKGAHEIKYWDNVDTEIATNSLTMMIQNPDYFCRAIIGGNGKFVGGLICRIARTWFNTDFHAEGITIFIDPEYRGKGGASKLYKEFTEWGKSFDRVSNLSLQTSSGLDLEPIINKCGYKTIGKMYRMEVR